MVDHEREDDEDPGADAAEVSAARNDERRYVIPAQDAKGHSGRAQCRLQPQMVRLAEEIVQSRKFPFRIKGDLYRYCIVDGCRQLAAQAGIPSVLAQADAMIAILLDEEYHQQFVEAVGHMRRVIDMFLSENADDKARETVALLRHHVSRMPAGYWRDRYEKEIVSKYGSLLDAKHRTVTPSLFDFVSNE